MLFSKFSLVSKRGEPRRFDRKNLYIAISTLAFAGVAGQTMAQSDNTGVLEEIVVTAQKRAENMQDVPVAITAFSASMIARSGANGLSDMEAAAPSLNFGRGSRATRGEITIRGVGGFSRNPGVDARASVYVDGVYVGRSAVFDQDLQDVTGIEILRGPQGTLFGKNTISGAININTQKPHSEFEGKVSLGLGNFGYTSMAGQANIPLIEDKLFASVAATKLDRDGYIKNITLDRRINGIDRISGRAKLRYIASDDLEFNLSYDFLDEADWGGNGEAITRDSLGGGYSDAPKPREVSHDAQEREERDFWGVSLTADYDFGEDYTFTSITAYREAEWFNLNEEDYSSETMGVSIFDEQNEQFTQEFRITSPKDGAFDYVVGLFYIEQDIETSRNALLFGTTLRTPVQVDSSGYAAYIHSNYRLSDKLELTAGLRYTYEEKNINFNMTNVAADGSSPGLAGFLHLGDAVHKDAYDDDAVTPKIGLNYHLNEETMLYASYSKGYKSGGHNVDFIKALEQLEPYDSEDAVSYEIGLKSTLFDGRARFNISAFTTEFTNFQVQQFQQVTPAIKTVSVSNAGEVTTEGVEVELVVLPIEGLTLTANVAYVDAAFDKFEGCANGVDCDGHELPYAPGWKTYLAAEYEFTISDLGDAFVRFDYGYTGEYFTHSNNDKQDHLNPQFEVFNGRIGFQSADESWELAVWGKNLMDSEYTRMRELNFFNIPRGHYGAPRTYGIDVKYQF